VPIFSFASINCRNRASVKKVQRGRGAFISRDLRRRVLVFGTEPSGLAVAACQSVVEVDCVYVEIFCICLYVCVKIKNKKKQIMQNQILNRVT